MTTKFKIIFCGFLLTIISIAAFLFIMKVYIEKGYIEQYSEAAQGITNQYSLLKAAPIRKKRVKKGRRSVPSVHNRSSRDFPLPVLRSFINKMLEQNPDLALMAIADANHTILADDKNDSFITTARLYNSIIRGFTNGQLNIKQGETFTKHTFPYKKKDKLTCYIFINDVKNKKLLMVFPYKPGKDKIIRVVLGIALIIIIFIILSTVAFMVFTSPPKKEDDDKVIVADNIISLKPGDRAMETSANKASIDTSNSAARSLNSYVYSLFQKIQTQYNPESISLYLKDGTDKLSKSYELKGKSFIKIDSSTFDIIDTSSDIGLELKKAATMIMEKGKKVIIPVIFNNDLIGVVSLTSGPELSGAHIKDIKSSIMSIAGNLSDFLVINDVMTDKTTGLYSKSYFDMKYNEQLKLFETDPEKKTVFSLVFISLFNPDLELKPAQKNNVIKLTSPTLLEELKKDDYLCLYNDFLAAILPNTNSDQSIGMAEKLQLSLSRFRIKVQPDKILEIRPFFGIASSDRLKSGESMLDKAIHNLEYAMSRDNESSPV
ncbi:MAG: hypothetical protein GY754_42875 [bacterium]|nr:hypothetical protein [bacterium]